MTFRDAYRNDLGLVRPDEGVVNNILEAMKRESVNPTPVIRRIPVAHFAAAAAGVCILVAAVAVMPALLRDNDTLATNEAGMLLSSRDGGLAETADFAGGSYDALYYAEAEEDSADFDDDMGHASRAAPEGFAFDDEWAATGDMNVATPAPVMGGDEMWDGVVYDSDDAEFAATEVAPLTDPTPYYFDFMTVRDWDDGSLWRSLKDTFPIHKYTAPSYPPPHVQDILDEEPIWKTFGEILEVFLTGEHALWWLEYQYMFINDDNRMQDDYGSIYFLDTLGGEGVLPFYSFLSTLRDSQIKSHREYFLDGSVRFSISGENVSFFVNIVESDEMIVSVYENGGDNFYEFVYAIEPGTFEMILSYLISLR